MEPVPVRISDQFHLWLLILKIPKVCNRKFNRFDTLLFIQKYNECNHFHDNWAAQSRVRGVSEVKRYPSGSG
jgi:hypothetical protein